MWGNMFHELKIQQMQHQNYKENIGRSIIFMFRKTRTKQHVARSILFQLVG